MNEVTKNFILGEFNKLKDLPSKERNKIIIANTKKKFNETINGDDIYEICIRMNRLKKNIIEIGNELSSAIEILNEGDEKQYEVMDIKGSLHYELKTKNKIFRIPVKDIDAIFKDYSKKGNNFSGEMMRQKYKLEPEAWSAIKGKLGLYKDSHVVSPYTLSLLSEQEEEIVIEEAISDHIDTKSEKFVNSYDKQFKKRANDAIKFKANFDYQLDLVRKAIDNYKPIKINYVREKLVNTNIAHFVMSDIHIGKMDSDGVIRRLNQLHTEILNCQEGIIHITCLGDLVETIAQGGMHEGMEYQVDHNMGHGFNLAMNTVHIFEKFLISLVKAGKQVYFKGLTGNHDRMTKRKEDDIWRSGGLFIYEMIKRGLSQIEIDIEYFREAINVFNIDNIQYITNHGDNGFTKRKATDIAWKNAKQGLYTIILSGDIHQGRFQEDKDLSMVTCRALAGKGAFDKSLDLHSQPGFLTIKKNQYDLPNITFNSLPH